MKPVPLHTTTLPHLLLHATKINPFEEMTAEKEESFLVTGHIKQTKQCRYSQGQSCLHALLNKRPRPGSYESDRPPCRSNISHSLSGRQERRSPVSEGETELMWKTGRQRRHADSRCNDGFDFIFPERRVMLMRDVLLLYSQGRPWWLCKWIQLWHGQGHTDCIELLTMSGIW